MAASSAMLFLLAALPVVVVAVIQGDVKGSRFSREDKQKILDIHNELRAKVAKGEESGQPRAADMIALEWDDRLEQSAQRWASRCQAGHNSNSDRKFEPYIYVGQSFTYNYGLEKSMEVWYDEVKDPGYRYGGDFGGAGHYTQMIWGPTTKVGCAYQKCGGEAMVVCEFAPGGNLNWAGTPDKTYKRGAPCSDCPAGYGYCMGGMLCASSRACQSSDSQCECTVKSCEHGKMDRGSCTCTCNDGWTDASCNKKCSNGGNCPKPDLPPAQKDQWCRWDSDSWMWMMKECPETCERYCKPLPDLGGNRNSQGLKVNVKVVEKLGKSGGREKGNCENNRKGDECDMWAGNGECENNPVYMKRECASSCNSCPDEATGGTGTKPKGKCADEHANCEFWASAGECKKNPDYMLTSCPSSCNSCPNGGGGGTKPGCQNKRAGDDCDSWAARGECQRNPDGMGYWCARSCNKC